MPPAESQDEAAIANPTLQNYLDQDGSLSIEERGDLGQIGVCYFENNRQCEEWALLRGDCRVGGVEVTASVTPAGRYGAITGGVGDERMNYWCPSLDPGQQVVNLGEPQPGMVWTAHWAVLTGRMPDSTVLETAMVPVRTVWR